MAGAQGGAGMTGLDEKNGGVTSPRGSGVGCRDWTEQEQAEKQCELLSTRRAADAQAGHKTLKTLLSH
jgi:hypothetical protein